MSYAAAFVLAVCVELPMMQLENVLFFREKRSSLWHLNAQYWDDNITLGNLFKLLNVAFGYKLKRTSLSSKLRFCWLMNLNRVHWFKYFRFFATQFMSRPGRE